MDCGGAKRKEKSSSVGRKEGENLENLKILYTNTQSVLKKLNELKVLATDKEPEIIVSDRNVDTRGHRQRLFTDRWLRNNCEK